MDKTKPRHTKQIKRTNDQTKLFPQRKPGVKTGDRYGKFLLLHAQHPSWSPISPASHTTPVMKSNISCFTHNTCHEIQYLIQQYSKCYEISSESMLALALSVQNENRQFTKSSSPNVYDG